MTASERAEELSGKGLREQLISFRVGIRAQSGGLPIFDIVRNRAPTASDLFVIPVGQVSLGEPEKTYNYASRHSGWGLYQESDAPPGAVSGQFNNILLFDRKKEQLTTIFDRRISVTSFYFGVRSMADLIVMFATEEDSNNDGVLDADDRQDVYVYRLNDRTLHKAGLKGVNPIELSLVSNPDFIVVTAVVDRDHDGHAMQWPMEGRPEEPATLIRLDLQTYQATPFVLEAVQAELQNALEARK